MTQSITKEDIERATGRVQVALDAITDLAQSSPDMEVRLRAAQWLHEHFIAIAACDPPAEPSPLDKIDRTAMVCRVAGFIAKSDRQQSSLKLADFVVSEVEKRSASSSSRSPSSKCRDRIIGALGLFGVADYDKIIANVVDKRLIIDEIETLVDEGVLKRVNEPLGSFSFAIAKAAVESPRNAAGFDADEVIMAERSGHGRFASEAIRKPNERPVGCSLTGLSFLSAEVRLTSADHAKMATADWLRQLHHRRIRPDEFTLTILVEPDRR